MTIENSFALFSKQFKSHKRVKEMSNANPSADKRTFVIIGGGELEEQK